MDDNDDRSKQPEQEAESSNAEYSRITGVVVLMKKNSFAASGVDRVDELRRRKVALQLICTSTTGDQYSGHRRKFAKKAFLEEWTKEITPLAEGDMAYNVTFEWNEEMGVPGAFTIANFHHSEIYLKTLTFAHIPGYGRVHFICNSWVYPAEYYKKDRVFFTNQTYLPSRTPAALRGYREEELENLRGNGTEKLEDWDRVYDYDIYNDLGDPDKGIEYARPILGGSNDYPFPRRGRTGRPPASSDPNTESRPLLYDPLNTYIPRDERFSKLKMSDLHAALNSIVKNVVRELEDLSGQTSNEFDSIQDVLRLYEGFLIMSNESLLKKIRKRVPFQKIKELLRSDIERPLKLPIPQVIREDKTAWASDEEFAREMLAGINPVVIRRLQEFPPRSKLDPQLYGIQSSTISEEHIINNLDGMTIFMAIENKKLFILDHHDSLMPYLRRINNTSTKTYATRTILFLKPDGTLKPVAIELSLPHPDGDHYGALSKVYTPSEDGVEGSLWQLAKTYVTVNDSGYHQLVCHWLHTHLAIEPFIISTNRQLSVLHPIHKLLQPHFRDTMHMNVLARNIFMNAGGFLEHTVFPGKYSMELSSTMYKEWVFPEQALPADLIKRGLAVEDPSSQTGIRLLIEDYPFAVDGLEIWAAIKTWVEDYCYIYYKNDNMVQQDFELQSWWKEVREKGHADKKHEPWWPEMHTIDDLINSCTIIIWISSALHAALNFGQYAYGGYLPNRPTMSRRFMPEICTPEYEELKSNPEKVFLKTITSQLQSMLGISLIEILSRHYCDEVFLGQRDSPEWTSDKEALEAFEMFGKRLLEIEERIMERNIDGRLKNRMGPVKMPYTLLYPSSDIGLTGMGIPNSVSI